MEFNSTKRGERKLLLYDHACLVADVRDKVTKWRYKRAKKTVVGD